MITQKVNFTSLYRRNAKGVWNNLTYLINVYPIGPATVVIKFLLLPLTLTIGAGIKSLIDYFTRKPLSSHQYESTANKLSSMTDDEIETCAAAISKKYSMPKSKSSNALVKFLMSSVDERAIRDGVAYTIRAKKIARATECLKTDGITISAAMFNVSFSKEELDEINQCTKDKLAEKKKENTCNKKEKLISFFNDSNNVGKKMQHVIMEETINKGLK